MSLYRVIQSHIKDFENKFYTSIPAVVDSYDPLECTINAQISISDIDTDGVIRIPPILDRVPLLLPSTGSSAITFPVKKGDKIILHFCHSNIETFFTQNKENFENVTDPRTLRKHDINDCFATLGLRTYDDTVIKRDGTLDIYHNNSRITISEDGKLEIEIKNPDTGVDSNIDIETSGEIIVSNDKEGSNITLKANGDISVDTKAKFSVDNGTVELVELLSDLINTLANTTVNTTYGLSILNSKSQLQALKTKIDTMKK